jgi:pentatricopeptide repeat protein
MTSLLNAANINLGIFNNYMTDLAVSVLFGMGYYLVKTIRKRKNSANTKDEKTKVNLVSRLENALKKWNYARNLEEYHELIKSNWGECDPYKILNMMAEKGLTPTIETFNALLLNCYRTSNFSGAEKIKEDLLDETHPVQPDNFTLNILLKGASLKLKNCQNKYEDFDNDSAQIIKLLKERGVTMDIIAHNTVIDALIDQGRLQEAYDYYQNLKLQKNGDNVEFDYYTFTSLLKGIRLTPNIESVWLDRAFSLLEDIESMKIPKIEENFFNAILDTCVKFNDLQRTETLFKNMIKKNIAKEYAYCIMIKAYSRNFQLGKAIEMFEFIKQLCLDSIKNPSIISYGAIINACVKSQDIKRAENYFLELRTIHKSESLNAFIYSTMIKGWSKEKNFEKAMEIYNDVLSRADPKEMTCAFFNSILNCCIQCEKLNKMFEIYENFKILCNTNQEDESQSSLNLQPDIITYSTVMKGYIKLNKIPKVMDLYNFLSSDQRFTLDEVMFNTLLDCFAKNKDEKNLLKILNDMKKKDIHMSVITYGVLIKLYTNLGDVFKAEETFKEMKRRKIKPSVITFQLLIRLFAQNGQVQKAIYILKSMKEMNVSPDHILYETILSLCINNGFVEEAFDIIQNASLEGIKLADTFYDDFVYSVMESYLSRNKKKNILTHFYSELKQNDYHLHFSTLQAISRFMYSNQQRKNYFSYKKCTEETSIYV